MIGEEIAGALRVLPEYLAYHVILSVRALRRGLTHQPAPRARGRPASALALGASGRVSLIEIIPSLVLLRLLIRYAGTRHAIGNMCSGAAFRLRLPAGAGRADVGTRMPPDRRIATGIMSLDGPDRGGAWRRHDGATSSRVELLLAAPSSWWHPNGAVSATARQSSATPVGQTKPWKLHLHGPVY